MKSASRILIFEGLALFVFAALALFFTGLTTLYPIVFGGIGLLSLVIGFAIDFNSILEGFGRRTARYGVNAVLYSAIFLGILAALNYLGHSYNKDFDLTKAGVNTLSEQTKTVVANLPAAARLVGFFKAAESYEFKKLAQRYAALGGKVEYEIIDPDLHPELVKNFSITERGAVAVVCQDRTNITMDVSEQGLTTALLKVSQQAAGIVYYLEGHGEAPLDGKEERGFALLKEGLANENIPVQPLLLLTAGKIPEDAAMVIVNGPTNALLPEEIQLLRAHLEGGGRMLVALDPTIATGLETLLAEYGIKVGNDVVVEKQMRLFEGAVMGFDPLIQDYGIHEITKALGENPTLMHFARSLTIDNEHKLEGAIVEPLLRTGPGAWGEPDFSVLSSGAEPEYQKDADLGGPLVVGAAMERTVGEGDARKAARMVVFGDSDFNTNRYVAYGFNANLFLNAVNWLTGQEAYITVRPNTFAPDVFTLTEQDNSIIFFASVFLLPQLVVMLGIVVALRRRR